MVGFGSHNQPAGTWSDDTSMALAICDSYRQHGQINLLDIRQKFNSWMKNAEYTCGETFDVGNTTAQALISERGLTGEFSNGNGSLMRTVPLAFTVATKADVEAVSAITHAHEISKKACVGLVAVAKDLCNGMSPKKVAEKFGVNPSKSEDEIKSDGFVLHTFEASLWCLSNTSNYKDCVLKAVNLGDDTDTTGAVAGALAGIIYGYEGIPRKWIEQLRGKQVIERCLF